MTKAICSEDDCETVVRARGLCNKHYVRMRYREDPSRYRSKNQAAHAAAYYRRNREARVEANRRWREVNAEKVREAQRRRRSEDPERYGMYNRANAMVRYARKMATQVEPVDYAAILADHGMFCHICSMVIVDESDLHMDHVIPLAKGGTHTRDNIKPAHAVCNMRKGTRLDYV